VPLSERSGTFGLSERSGALASSETSGALGLSEKSGTLALGDRSGAMPRPVLDDATPVSGGTEPTGVFPLMPAAPAAAAVGGAAPIAGAPPVAEALDWARRATELEVTEPLPRVDPPPASAVVDDDAGARPRRALLTGVATAAAAILLCVVGGGVLWVSASEWTSPVDGGQRSSVVAPSEAAAHGETPPSEARIPSMPRGDDDEPATKRRSRPRASTRTDDLGEAPLETVEAPTKPDTTPILAPHSPLAVEPAKPAEETEVAAPAPPSPTADATAAADPPAPPADAEAPAGAGGTMTRPPA
jgi:hypothetical protein